MRHDAARPRKLRAEDEQSTTQESMRGSQPSVRRNPSTDQKKKRRQMQRSALYVCAGCQMDVDGRVASCAACGCTLQYTATVLPTNAERLQAGHVLRLPSGQRVKVKAIRPHENSGQHVYLDTDIGTSVVDRKHQFHVVQGDAATRGAPFRQQTNPQAPGQFNTGLAESTEAPKAPGAAGKCPSCGKGPLSNHGGKMVCRNCGYSSSGGDTDFGEAGYRRAAAYEHDGRTAVVRRAQALVERTGQ